MSKEKIGFAAGVLAGLTVFAFGIQFLMAESVKGISSTSFMAWTAMDATCLILAWKRKENISLFLGWTVSAVFTTGCLIYRGAPGSFGFVEMVALAVVLISIYGMWIGDTKAALFACAVGMFVAGVPQLIAYSATGDTSSWYLWVGAAVAGTVTLAVSPKVNAWGNAPTISSIILQVLMLIAMFR